MIQRVTISLEKELLEEIKSMAKREKLSLSKFIAKSLEEYIIERKKKEAGRKLLRVRLNERELKDAFEELQKIRGEEKDL